MSKPFIVPVILSGGMGKRLWPLSRGSYPKQFINLNNPELSLIQETVLRVNDRSRFAPPVIVSNADHRFLVAERMQRIGVDDAAIILEPCPRNTAPAIGAAAAYINEKYNNAYMLVMPSDHIIQDNDEFFEAVEAGIEAASHKKLVTFGITPERAETGFGYIRMGEKIKNGLEAHKVEEFVEKPDSKTAEKFVKSGEYTWNSGIFLFPASLYASELKKLEPEIAALSEKAVSLARQESDFLWLDEDVFCSSPEQSVDYAVMEHTSRSVVVPVSCGWSDAGSWDALWNMKPKDENGNVVTGDAYAVDTKNCYIACDEGTRVATLGVDDLTIVSTKDCILVANRNKAQDIKKLVSYIDQQNPMLVKQHRKVYRPWGNYDSIDTGSRHQVKRILVKPGAKLSDQMHYHRAEHWVVVRGTAVVERDGEKQTITENQSIYIPYGTRHRIANPGKIPLEIIEVQSGSYLGEDDIVRFDDNYGRTGTEG